MPCLYAGELREPCGGSSDGIVAAAASAGSAHDDGRARCRARRGADMAYTASPSARSGSGGGPAGALRRPMPMMPLLKVWFISRCRRCPAVFMRLSEQLGPGPTADLQARGRALGRLRGMFPTDAAGDVRQGHRSDAAQGAAFFTYRRIIPADGLPERLPSSVAEDRRRALDALRTRLKPFGMRAARRQAQHGMPAATSLPVGITAFLDRAHREAGQVARRRNMPGTSFSPPISAQPTARSPWRCTPNPRCPRQCRRQ